MFVNTCGFAERLKNIMKKKGLKVHIMFGGKMSKEERDDVIDKFRKGEIMILITTNLLARGLDVPQVQLVINFDVPTYQVGRGDHR